MENMSIGTATFVVSEHHDAGEQITDQEAAVVADGLVNYLNFLLEEKQLNNQVAISGMEWQRGCITIVVTFSIIGAVAGGYVLIDAIKDYKEVREGLLTIFEDLKNASVWIAKKTGLKKSGKDAVQKTKIADKQPGPVDDPFSVMFEQAINNYESTPQEFRKYWTAGQDITITNEKGESYRYTLALKCEDLTKPGTAKKPLRKVKSRN